MKLHIVLPDNLIVKEMVQQKNIPCICKVSKEFKLEFIDPLPEATGIVLEWDRRLLDERAMAGAGGDYTHYAHGMVTLEKVDQNVFAIMDLSFFNRSVGWCSILLNGEYGPPGEFWDDDDS